MLIRSIHSNVSVRLVQLEEYVRQVRSIFVNYILTSSLIFTACKLFLRIQTFRDGISDACNYMRQRWYKGQSLQTFYLWNYERISLGAGSSWLTTFQPWRLLGVLMMSNLPWKKVRKTKCITNLFLYSVRDPYACIAIMMIRTRTRRSQRVDWWWSMYLIIAKTKPSSTAINCDCFSTHYHSDLKAARFASF